MIKKSTKPSIYKVLVGSVLICLIMLLIGVIVINWLPYSIKITDITLAPHGGSCEYVLYDKNGNGYKTIKTEYTDNSGAPLYRRFTTLGYEGPAPLYDVKPEDLRAQPGSNECFEFPNKIDPITAQNGISMYPIYFEAQNKSKSKWLKVGESYPFTAKAQIGDSFPSSLDWTPVIPIGSGELVEAKFALYTTNFDFSPTNQETHKIPLGINLPAEQTWSIAPIERANGTQHLSASVEGDNFVVDIEINLEIRNILGINPKLLAIIIPIGSVVAFLLTQTKTITDILQTNKSKKKKPKKKKRKK